MPLTKQLLKHVRRHVVAYLALVVALGTSTAYAAGSIPNGSVTAAKLHTNAVTSTKIKNGTIKNKDMRKPTYVQSSTLGAVTPPAGARRGQHRAVRLLAAEQVPDLDHGLHPGTRGNCPGRPPRRWVCTSTPCPSRAPGPTSPAWTTPGRSSSRRPSSCKRVRTPARSASPARVESRAELARRRDLDRDPDRLRFHGVVRRRTLLGLPGLGAAVLALAACGGEDEPVAAGTRTIRYGDDPSQYVELSAPDDTPRGVVVVIHGGSGRRPRPLARASPGCRPGRKGWAALNIEYRRVASAGESRTPSTTCARRSPPSTTRTST